METIRRDYRTDSAWSPVQNGIIDTLMEANAAKLRCKLEELIALYYTAITSEGKVRCTALVDGFGRALVTLGAEQSDVDRFVEVTRLNIEEA